MRFYVQRNAPRLGCRSRHEVGRIANDTEAEALKHAEAINHAYETRSS
jgi:hypothetical protein